LPLSDLTLFNFRFDLHELAARPAVTFFAECMSDVRTVIMCTETQHDPNCEGCKSCDDSSRESCHRLCSRSEAIRRMRRCSETGTYVVLEKDQKIYARELKRWSTEVIAARCQQLGYKPPSETPVESMAA
jgi:hypothetical protein